jgi:MurNAc alpha-1-phosphate uridylyltransferase
MMYPVAILAGGLATRMRPVTYNIPKSLINVAGLPFIARQLNYLKGQNINRVVLCVGHLGEQIEALVGNGDSFGISVSYSYDGKDLLGTGGAIRKALPLLGNNFFVLYGDSFLPIDYGYVQDFYNKAGKNALMTVFKNLNLFDKSNIIYNDGKIELYDKFNLDKRMKYIDYGLGIVSSSVFCDLQFNSPFDLAELYNELSLNKQLSGLEFFEEFYEIGSIEGLRRTENFFTKEQML